MKRNNHFELANFKTAFVLYLRTNIPRWRQRLLFTTLSAGYILAWVWVMNLFTLFVVGLMVLATIALVLEDYYEYRRGYPVNLADLRLASITVWFLLPFQLALAYWLVGML